ncbi:MAG: RNA polymerase sigma-70 factor, partial [Pedobacter sp.]
MITVEIKTGKDLFNLINEGHVKPFTQFYNQFFQKLLLATDKHVKDVHVAEEIVQDVFLKIWENPENLEKIISIKAYLYRSVINAGINHLNRQKNIDEHHQKIAINFTDEDLIELDEENELVVLLHREIEKLPQQCKKVFKLNRFEHLKYKEIALALNISERTVENHIANALKILKKALLDDKVVKKSSNGYKLM